MNRGRLLTFASLGLTVALNAAPTGRATDPPPYRVTAVRPFLYFADSGRLSREVPGNASLWNTPTGEGWAGHSSSSTLVAVTVSGASGSYVAGRRVRLTVRSGKAIAQGTYRWGAVTFTRAEAISVLTSAGRSVVGFWLYDTGCTPLQLTATVVGQGPTAAVTRVLPFACGE